MKGGFYANLEFICAAKELYFILYRFLFLQEKGIQHSYPSHTKPRSRLLKKIRSFFILFHKDIEPNKHEKSEKKFLTIAESSRHANQP